MMLCNPIQLINIQYTIQYYTFSQKPTVNTVRVKIKPNTAITERKYIVC